MTPLIKETTKGNGQKPHFGREPETAKIIAQHLKDTPADQMQETTYIPLRMVHVLSMLQALEGQYDKMQRQIIEVDTWQKRQLDNNYTPEESDEPVVKQSHNIFIYRFRNALYQHFRGKDGNFLEKMVILADTDLQTRGSSGLDDIFKKPMREQ